MKQAILALFFVSTLAYGAIYQRQHADTIVSDKKILADDLNDEFNAILTAVNGIDASNIVNGSIGVNQLAATSSAVMTNRKIGCGLAYAGITPSVNVEPPCEIAIDGVRGVITATENVSAVTDLENGTLAAQTFYYVYARISGASLDFKMSVTPPVSATTRKVGDSTAKYVGTVRTGNGTSNFMAFFQNGNEFVFDTSDVTIDSTPGTLAATLTTSQSNFTTGTPPHFESVLLRYSAYVSGFPAQCEFQVSNAFPSYHAIVIATGGHIGVVPFWVPLQASGTLTAMKYVNRDDCITGGDVRVLGWQDPLSFHE